MNKKEKRIRPVLIATCRISPISANSGKMPNPPAGLERLGIRSAELEGCYSGARRRPGCLLAGYLFLHLLLHFLRCGLCNVGSDHPSVALGIDNGSTAVAPKHIHHGSLRGGAELYGFGNRLVYVLRQ